MILKLFIFLFLFYVLFFIDKCGKSEMNYNLAGIFLENLFAKRFSKNVYVLGLSQKTFKKWVRLKIKHIFRALLGRAAR